MRLETRKVEAAAGTVLAHSLKLDDGTRLRKGQLLDEALLERLAKAGVDELIVAVPEAGDILENEAATRIAAALGTTGIVMEAASTGRVNFFAAHNGLFQVSRAVVDRINRIDPAITLATLNDLEAVNEGRMVATIKIIPYGVSASAMNAIAQLDTSDAFAVLAFKPMRVGMVATQLPTVKESTLEKTRRALEQRLSPSGSRIIAEKRVPHEAGVVTEAVEALRESSDIIVIFGASAICDRHDTIPTAIEAAGGEILHFGMPVDPGNLLLLARLGKVSVLGAPGCARSPAENGFDWVLQRLLAGVEVVPDDLTGMGVGGLLMETGSRPHPRGGVAAGQLQAAAIILAAGQSRRMGALNKLVAELGAMPIVRHVGEAAAGSKCGKVITVTGHEPEKIEAALDGLGCRFVHNERYGEGLAASLGAGVAALEAGITHALILLGDMPLIEPAMIDRMLEAAKEAPEGTIVVATHNGKRGNPVLWPSRYFAELRALTGDTGARHLIGQYAEQVIEIELGEAASRDIDTPGALESARAKPGL